MVDTAMAADPDHDEHAGAAPEEAEEPRPQSRSRHRREAGAFTELAEALARGRHPKLPDPPFDADLRQAIAESQRFHKNARSRQIRRVAQLLRGAGSIEELRAALAGQSPEQRTLQARERAVEAWRARILEEGDPALNAFVAEHPGSDRQQLRALMRQAKRAPAEPRSKRASKALLRAIREASASNVAAEPPSPDEA